MLVLSLCQTFCSDKIPYVTQKLGDGADGEVFNILDATDQVIKLSVLYEYAAETLTVVEYYQQKIAPVLDFLVAHPVEGFARVYSHQYLGVYDRPAGHNEEQFVLYNYVMEKLNHISGDERRVFSSILSHEDSGTIKNYSLAKIKKILQGLACGLDFDEKKVILFCENLHQAPVRHLDIHTRNIMKDASGNFKLIDFDRCVLGTV
jgi:serine/threonine protein kinase